MLKVTKLQQIKMLYQQTYKCTANNTQVNAVFTTCRHFVDLVQPFQVNFSK